MNDKLVTEVISSSPPESKEEFVYQTLREAIISGQLKPGMNLVQTDLAKQLNVSTIPIRTAIRRLATEGLVELEPNRPPSVSVLSIEETKEILMIRNQLEFLAGSLAFPRLTENDIQQLWKLIERMEDALKKGELHLYGSINKEFHLRINEVCQSPLLIQMIKDLWDNSDRHRSRSVFLMVPGLAQQSNQEHHELMKLLENKKFDLAVDLLKEHKLSARNKFFEVLKEKEVE